MPDDINDLLLKNFGFEIAVWPIEQFKGRRNNPKRHRHKDLSALHESFSQTGFKDFIKYDPVADEIVDGHGRVAQAISDGMASLPVLIIRDLTPDKIKLLALAYNRTAELASYDDHLLIENLAELKNLNINIDFLNYGRFNNEIDMAVNRNIDLVELSPVPIPNQIVRELPTASAPQQSVLSTSPKPPKNQPGAGLADVIFPGEPEFGIPKLGLEHQATEAPAKFAKWAELSAKDRTIQGWHFYAEDYKLDPIWNNPSQLLAGNALCFGEINFSIRKAHSRGYALGQIYRKRQISRWLQSKGRKIFVDLNVGRTHLQDNFLGVPEGFKAYITRGSVEKIPYIIDQFEAALKHSQVDELFAVIYGGGVEVEDFAKESGAVYIPERMTAVRENGSDGLAPKVSPAEYKKKGGDLVG